MKIGFVKPVVLASTVTVFLLSIVFWPGDSGAKAQSASELFSLKTTPRAFPGEEKNSPASVMESDINLNTDAFRSGEQKTLVFPLFDGRMHRAVQRKSEGYESRRDGFTWRGIIPDEEFRGDVVLTSYKGVLNGLIHTRGAAYEIIAIGDRQILIQLDHSQYPECGGEIKPSVSEPEEIPENLGVLEDSGDRIDVLVVYTLAVKNAVGGDAQANALAQAAIDATNTAYINSKVRQRVRLVHTEETALTEANSLGNLRADAATQALRNTHSADMVAMLTNSLGGCGVAYVMSNVSTGFAPSAYSVTLRTCAVGNLTFAHELGHNMGSTHDPANGGSSAYPYSFGHYVSGNYRTVMSYSNQCTGGCTRRPQFSNPDVEFQGAATGLRGTRNNARSLEGTADTVANFRSSGTAIKLDNYSEDAALPRLILRTLNWSSNNVAGNVRIELSRDEGTTWSTLVNNTANDGFEIISIGGRASHRARIRVASVNDGMIRDSSAKNIAIR